MRKINDKKAIKLYGGKPQLYLRPCDIKHVMTHTEGHSTGGCRIPRK